MSRYDEQIEQMLAYKESLGYSRRSYKDYLKDLASYLSEKGIDKEILSLDDILPWCVQRKTEKPSGFERRIMAARQWTIYLYAMGRCDGVIPTELYPSRNPFNPHIFSNEELLALFSVSDHQKGDPIYPFSKEILSVIYRLIFYCGLRPDEGRQLLSKDFDPKEGTLIVRKNKAKKERLIPLANDVAEMLRQYVIKRDCIAPESEYLFPNAKGKAYSKTWLQTHFKDIWKEAYPDREDVAVRVYDFRHTFATMTMMKLMDEGRDIRNTIPYLSAYLGHGDYKSTLYYVHLLPDRLKNSPSIDWDTLEDLIPEVQE